MNSETGTGSAGNWGDYCPVDTTNSVADTAPAARHTGTAVTFHDVRPRLSNNPPSTSTFSWELWAKVDPGAVQPFEILDWGTSSPRLQLRVDGGDLQVRSSRDFSGYADCGTSAIADSEWHHIVLTRSAGEKLRVFVDAQEECSWNATTSGYLGFATFGPNIEPPTGETYEFSLDELAHYQHALTKQRVRVHYGEPADDPDELAAKFRPLLYFDNAEQWRPLDVDQFLGELFTGTNVLGQAASARHRLCDAAGACTDIEGPPDLDGAASDDYINVVGNGQTVGIGEELFNIAPTSDPFMPGCEETVLADCDDGRTAIYYRTATNASYYLLDYWWLYRWDDGYATQGSHEGDWEGLVVAVPKDGDGAASATFDWVGFDAHGPTWRYIRDVLRCDGGGDGSCGSESSSSGTRVNSYVSSGKHATYPRDCDSDAGFLTICDAAGGSPFEGGFDGGAPWASNSRSTALEELPEETESWLAYQGFWGSTTSRGLPADADSPRGPADDSHGRWVNPTATSCEDRWFEDETACDGASAATTQSTPSGCGSWLGPQVVVGICEDGLLAEAVAAGTLLDENTFEIRPSAQDGRRSGSAVGLAQMVGKPLKAGDEILLSSSHPSADQVVVQYYRGTKLYRARWDDIDLSAAPTAKVKIGPTGWPRLAVGGATRVPDSTSLLATLQ